MLYTKTLAYRNGGKPAMTKTLFFSEAFSSASKRN
jgi:hypothetical protein